MRLLKITLLVLLISTLIGCNLNSPALPLPTASSTPLIVETGVPAPAPTESAADGWQGLAAGMDWRTLLPGDNLLAQTVLLRLDPTQYTFRVHYRPGDPLTLARWRETLPDALIIVNANFFDPENNVIGLLISDGSVYGSTFRDRGGMFAIQNGLPLIRSNIREPYQGEAYDHAVQGFPMLVEGGQQMYFNPSSMTRRTAIGLDAAGNVILLATPLLGLRLADLSALLATELQLVSAFNLDGGGSTMLWVAGADFTLSSFDPVPAVLAVYAK